mgnify:FL=1
MPSIEISSITHKDVGCIEFEGVMDSFDDGMGYCLLALEGGAGIVYMKPDCKSFISPDPMFFGSLFTYAIDKEGVPFFDSNTCGYRGFGHNGFTIESFFKEMCLSYFQRTKGRPSTFRTTPMLGKQSDYMAKSKVKKATER